LTSLVIFVGAIVALLVVLARAALELAMKLKGR
jgi:hypothetical protein